eukprot:2859227-Pleurochrysis_carterae.AAC.1
MGERKRRPGKSGERVRGGEVWRRWARFGSERFCRDERANGCTGNVRSRRIVLRRWCMVTSCMVTSRDGVGAKMAPSKFSVPATSAYLAPIFARRRRRGRPRRTWRWLRCTRRGSSSASSHRRARHVM